MLDRIRTLHVHCTLHVCFTVCIV